MEQRDTPYVSGYRIWQYELPWTAKSVTRVGYLFMGAPNERSTAQPPRDFYVYFIQPYDPPKFTNEKKSDEVFFRLEKPDDEFTEALRRYAGANALAGESTVTHRAIYDQKRGEALRVMVEWLKKHMAEAMTFTYEGATKPLGVWLAASSGSRATVKEQIDTIAASALLSHFEARYPGYPPFGASITDANIGESLRQAISQVVTGKSAALGPKVLASLGLADLEGKLTGSGAPAAELMRLLSAGGGKAVNRAALLAERDPGVFTWGPWHLEPEWLVLTAAVLCQLGRLEIGFPTGQLDAPALNRLLPMTRAELLEISHVAPPKPTPVAKLREIAEILGLSSAMVPNNGANEAVVKQLLTAAEAMRTKVADAANQVTTGVQLWGALVIDRQNERTDRLQALQKLLENVVVRDSVGKMNKIEVQADALEAARIGVAELKWVESASTSRNYLSPAAEYLREATNIFSGSDPIEAKAESLRQQMLGLFASENPIDTKQVTSLKADGERLRDLYTDEAVRAHARDRLDAAGDERKRQILEGGVFRDMKALTAVKMVPVGVFGSIETSLVKILTCKTFDETKLKTSVVCDACGYRPEISTGPTASARIDDIATKLSEVRRSWEKALLDSLTASEIAEQVDLLSGPERSAVQDFISAKALPEPVSDDLIHGINHALDRFEVRRIDAEEVWSAIFPADEAATIANVKDRFEKFVDDLRGNVPAERIRIIPDHGRQS